MPAWRVVIRDVVVVDVAGPQCAAREVLTIPFQEKEPVHSAAVHVRRKVRIVNDLLKIDLHRSNVGKQLIAIGKPDLFEKP